MTRCVCMWSRVCWCISYRVAVVVLLRVAQRGMNFRACARYVWIHAMWSPGVCAPVYAARVTVATLCRKWSFHALAMSDDGPTLLILLCCAVCAQVFEAVRGYEREAVPLLVAAMLLHLPYVLVLRYVG